MSDILSIGGSAVAAYQRALGTVSNNIANLTTVGYSRQEVDLSAGAPQAVGQVYLGTGVQVAGVKRFYDQFVEGTLRNSYSGLNTQGPLVQYANRVVDVMGGADVGLTSALDKFFSSAQALSGDPASIDLRGQFLRDTDAVGGRFRELNSQLATIGSDSKSEIEADLGNLNTMAQQLASVNLQLNKNPTLAAQPPELLDQRDQLLREMSKLVGITVTSRNNGEVNVGVGDAGGTGLLVEGGRARSLGATFSDASAGKVDILLDPYGQPVSIPGVTSGSIGGLISFRQQALEPALNQLDSLASTFADAVNKINKSGVDLNGNTGGDLYAMQPLFRVDAPTSSGDVQVSSKVVDPATFSFHDLQLRFDGQRQQWMATDLTTGVSARGSDHLTINGTELTISRGGQDGETVTLHADQHPSASIQLAVTDPRKIAAAALFRATPGAANTSGVGASVVFQAAAVVPTAPSKIDAVLVNNPNVSAGVPFSTSSYKGVATIPAGYSNLALYLDGVTSAEQNLQVFSKDGRQLIGKALDANQVNLLVKSQNGFSPGATYSDTYLNKSGSQGYRGLDVFYGARAVAGSAPVFDAATQNIMGYRQLPAQIDGAAILGAATNTNIPSAALTVNGVDLGPLNIPASGMSARDVAVWFNHQTAASGVTATATTQFEVPVGQLDLSSGVVINGQTINACATADDLAAAITASGAGVTASLNAHGGLVMTADDPGADIAITSPGAKNALGITSGTTVHGHISLSSANEIRVGISASGNPAMLQRLGLRAGAYLDGAVPEDLLVFATGSGSGSVAGAYTAQGVVNGAHAIPGNTPVYADPSDPANSKVIGYAPSPARLEGAPIANFSGATGATVITGGSVSINGSALPALTLPAGAMQAGDIATWVNSISAKTSVIATASNILQIPATRLDFTRGITINGQTIATCANAVALAQAINLAGASVHAEANPQGGLVLTAAVAGADIQIGGAGGKNALGLVNGTYHGSISLTSDHAIAVETRLPGSPDLSRLGLASTTYAVAGFNPLESARHEQLKIQFTSATTYTITDMLSANQTEIASREYDPAAGIQLGSRLITLSGTPAAGDVFTVDGNQDGVGNNGNIARVVELKDAAVTPEGKTISVAYNDLVSSIGIVASQATVAQQAMKAVSQQAEKRRDQTSGVNLDQEAADLVRFQQAYQAAAKTMQVASQLFDYIAQIR